MKKAHETETLEVGKWYLVAHAVLKYGNGEIRWVPIIPIAHKDPQFGTVGSLKHYHIDGRFNNYDPAFHLHDGHTNEVVTDDSQSHCNYKFISIEFKRKKCTKLSTGLLIHVRASKIYSNWAKTMEGKSCAGKKCPHFGAIMTEKDGKWVCPIHNLVGDPETQKIAKMF